MLSSATEVVDVSVVVTTVVVVLSSARVVVVVSPSAKADAEDAAITASAQRIAANFLNLFMIHYSFSLRILIFPTMGSLFISPFEALNAPRSEKESEIRIVRTPNALP